MTSRKKVPLGVRRKSTRPSEIRSFPHKKFRQDDAKCSYPGLSRSAFFFVLPREKGYRKAGGCSNRTSQFFLRILIENTFFSGCNRSMSISLVRKFSQKTKPRADSIQLFRWLFAIIFRFGRCARPAPYLRPRAAFAEVRTLSNRCA